MKKMHPKKNTTKLPVPYKVRKGFSIYCAIVLVTALVFTMSMTAFAANDDPLTVVTTCPTLFSDLSEQSVLSCSASVSCRWDFLLNPTIRRREPTAF